MYNEIDPFQHEICFKRMTKFLFMDEKQALLKKDKEKAIQRLKNMANPSITGQSDPETDSNLFKKIKQSGNDRVDQKCVEDKPSDKSDEQIQASDLGNDITFGAQEKSRDPSPITQDATGKKPKKTKKGLGPHKNFTSKKARNKFKSSFNTVIGDCGSMTDMGDSNVQYTLNRSYTEHNHENNIEDLVLTDRRKDE
jgi:hypothetical protein